MTLRSPQTRATALVVLAIVLCLGTRARAETTLPSAVDRMARVVADRLDKGAEIVVHEFGNNSDSTQYGGPGIRRHAFEALQQRGLKPMARGRELHSLKGHYQLDHRVDRGTQGEVKKVPVLRIFFQLIAPNSVVVYDSSEAADAKEFFGDKEFYEAGAKEPDAYNLATDDPKAISAVTGITYAKSKEDDPYARDPQKPTDVEKAAEDPKEYVDTDNSDHIVPLDDKGKSAPYAVQILVAPLRHDAAGKEVAPDDAAYKLVTPKVDVITGQAKVEIPVNHAYAIRIKNFGEFTIASAVFVDGLNMFVYSPDFPKKASGHWIINPEHQTTLYGWYVDTKSVDAFVTRRYGEGDKTIVKEKVNVGQITVFITAAWERGKTPPAGEENFGGILETGRGPRRGMESELVDFEIGKTPRASITVRY